MNELVLIGRGGQGVVLASQLLADTFARAGFSVQSFPEFKAERRGAPVSAFVRWDREPIHRRFKVRECDVLVVLCAAPPGPEILAKVRPGGLVLLNRESRFAVSGAFRVARVPASRIARSHGILNAEGRPIGNVALLGACVRLLLPGGIGFLEEAVSARMGALAPTNVVAAREGYERCIRQHARDTDPGPPGCTGNHPESPARSALSDQPYRQPLESHRLLVGGAAGFDGGVVRAQSLQRSIAAAEQERRRWARELHDETLQELAALKLVLATAQIAKDDQELGQQLQQASSRVDAAVRAPRDLITDLRPASLDELGLEAALEAFVERVARGSDLHVDLEVDLDEVGRFTGTGFPPMSKTLSIDSSRKP